MDSGESGQPGQPVTRPPVDTSQGRDSVTLQLLVLKGIHVMEKLMKLSGVTLIHVKVFIIHMNSHVMLWCMVMAVNYTVQPHEL